MKTKQTQGPVVTDFKNYKKTKEGRNLTPKVTSKPSTDDGVDRSEIIKQLFDGCTTGRDLRQEYYQILDNLPNKAMFNSLKKNNDGNTN